MYQNSPMIERLYQITNNERVELEIGFGNSPIISFLAKVNPSNLYIGVDKSRLWCKRIKNRYSYISNLAIFESEAQLFLENHLRSSSLDAMHIYFPSPYPLRFRLINRCFELESYRVLKPFGILRIATDNRTYFNSILNVFNNKHWWITTWINPITLISGDTYLGTQCEEKFGNKFNLQLIKV